MSEIPADLRYSNDHLWARPDPRRPGPGRGHRPRPAPGDAVQAAQACGDIESVKSVSDVVAPVTRTVRTANAYSPARPNSSRPTRRPGGMFEAEIDPSTLDRQLADLMDASAYRSLAGG